METTRTARKYEAGTNQAPNDPAIWVQATVARLCKTVESKEVVINKLEVSETSSVALHPNCQPRSAIGICAQGFICFKNLRSALALDRKASDRPYPGRQDFSVVERAAYGNDSCALRVMDTKRSASCGHENESHRPYYLMLCIQEANNIYVQSSFYVFEMNLIYLQGAVT
uniref:Uncharacterized protein n=1 Tax=Tanacetum cinerariifolium TaxID=118510 RepID=A0A6L2N9N1_TANCI|nr:hypothetical protein [Tanacetum cinerariifolium]